MSEARIIWFYLQMIFRPDNALLGLYHDDFIISRSLLAPLTTLFAILGIIGLITLAFWQRKNAPIMAFGILFFLVGHSLESSIIPLELIFEHRNYLPSAGLFIALIYYLVVAPTRRRLRYCTIASAILFIVICASNTAFRAQDWANPTTMIMAEVKHHPNSPRANFAAANVLAGTILNTVDSKEKETLYPLARHFFTQSVNLNREAAFGLLGLIILDLHMDKPVEQRLLDDLKYRLEHVRYSAYNFGTGVLYHLIRIHLSGEQKLPPKELLSITNAALRNQTLDKYTQAGINAGLRSYHLMVLNDPKLALKHGYEAIKARPQNVQYRISLIRILLNMGEINQARQQLHLTREADRNQLYTQQTQALEREIERVLQAE
ncbi:hypothetical protein MNBD_GAMMA26-587 [hydrothermal vent metagenome]|uniref:Uncharacterized protein n=1 Tax=hydrothermal vent metagenome TaxID=652676 RepID=A0A3B1BR90_9ZZZZ